MRIKTHTTNQYRGDTFKRLDAHMVDGRIIPIIGIYRESGQWANDTNERRFSTVAEAKIYAELLFSERGIK